MTLFKADVRRKKSPLKPQDTQDYQLCSANETILAIHIKTLHWIHYREYRQNSDESKMFCGIRERMALYKMKSAIKTPHIVLKELGKHFPTYRCTNGMTNSPIHLSDRIRKRTIESSSLRDIVKKPRLQTKNIGTTPPAFFWSFFRFPSFCIRYIVPFWSGCYYDEGVQQGFLN